MQKNIIGVDLGATSGRVILARAGGDRLRMEELHRFPNRMREIDGRFYWDIHALADAIYSICHNDSLFHYLQNEGKNEVDQITWEKVGARIKNLYERVLAGEL